MGRKKPGATDLSLVASLGRKWFLFFVYSTAFSFFSVSPTIYLTFLQVCLNTCLAALGPCRDACIQTSFRFNAAPQPDLLIRSLGQATMIIARTRCHTLTPTGVQTNQNADPLAPRQRGGKKIAIMPDQGEDCADRAISWSAGSTKKIGTTGSGADG